MSPKTIKYLAIMWGALSGFLVALYLVAKIIEHIK